MSSCVGSSCLICDAACGAISCSSISSDSGCRSVLLASRQRQRASRKSQKRSLGNSPCAARKPASRNVVLKTSCALRESPSIKKQKRYSCGKFCVRSDTLPSFVFAKFSALYAVHFHRQELIRLSCTRYVLDLSESGYSFCNRRATSSAFFRLLNAEMRT